MSFIDNHFFNAVMANPSSRIGIWRIIPSLLNVNAATPDDAPASENMSSGSIHSNWDTWTVSSTISSAARTTEGAFFMAFIMALSESVFEGSEKTISMAMTDAPASVRASINKP